MWSDAGRCVDCSRWITILVWFALSQYGRYHQWRTKLHRYLSGVRESDLLLKESLVLLMEREARLCSLSPCSSCSWDRSPPTLISLVSLQRNSQLLIRHFEGIYLRTVVETFDMGHHADMWYTSRLFMMTGVGLTVMLPLSCLKSLRAIAFASLLALFAMFYAVFLIPFSYVRVVVRPDWNPPHYHLFYRADWSIVSSFATIGMAYINHAVLIESTAEMQAPTPRRKLALISCSSIIVTFIYVMVSVAGYLHYGDHVSDNILNSEPLDAIFTSARIAVAFVVSLSYPLLCAPARLCLDWLASEIMAPTTSEQEDERRWFSSLRQSWNAPRVVAWRFYIETVLIFMTSYMVAVLIPGLDKIFALFGAMSGSLIVYIFPALFYRSIARQKGML